MFPLRLALVFLALVAGSRAGGQNLNEVPTDLKVPAMEAGEPGAGRRVRATTAGWSGPDVHHTIYLPSDWRPDATWPVIVEYAGNGNYSNRFGDTSDGTVEGAMLGYGLSGGRGFIWVVLPFIASSPSPRNTPTWWGDLAATKRYCVATVRDVCRRFGGDPARVVLMGFSRGAIACSYVGLHDPEIAALWCGFLAHSHFEGEFRHPAADAAAWPDRVRRLGARPLFISQELSTARTEAVLAPLGLSAPITYAPLPWPNHTARWVLCDVPLRTQARAWLHTVVQPRPPTQPAP